MEWRREENREGVFDRSCVSFVAGLTLFRSILCLRPRVRERQIKNNRVVNERGEKANKGRDRKVL